MLVVAPAAMVSVVFDVTKTSPDTAGDTADADTVTVVASLDGRSRVADTALSPAFSEMVAGERTSVTTGAGSSSSRVTSTPPAGPTTRPVTVVVPVTVSVSSGSSTWS